MVSKNKVIYLTAEVLSDRCMKARHCATMKMMMTMTRCS